VSGEWYVSILSPEAREVFEMFGYEGNTEDYWIGTPYDRSPHDDWFSADDLVTRMRRAETDEWRVGRYRVGDSFESRETIERMVREEPNAHDRAGGLVGVDEDYRRVKAGLIALGRSGRR
jgi:hypothetical protein